APTGAGTRERGNTDLTGMMDPVDGVNTTNSAGLSYSDDLSDKVSVYGKYAYTNRRNQTIGQSLMQSYYDFYEITSLNEKDLYSENINHQMAWDVEIQVDDRNYLKVSPNVSFNFGNSV